MSGKKVITFTAKIGARKWWNSRGEQGTMYYIPIARELVEAFGLRKGMRVKVTVEVAEDEG